MLTAGMKFTAFKRSEVTRPASYASGASETHGGAV